MKNPMTPAGIEPATFQFVAQHLNHCATAVPPVFSVLPIKIPVFKFQKLKTVLGKKVLFNTTYINTLLQLVGYMFQPYLSVIIRLWSYKENVTTGIL